MNNNYLTHHGVLGQKWGVRRYQNKDGTLTTAGKNRYDRAADAAQRDSNNLRKHGYFKEADAVQKVSDKNRQKANEKRAREEIRKQKKNDVKNRGILTDKQLQHKINRLQMEKQLKDLTESDINPGRKNVKRILGQIGGKVATTSLSGATLYAIKAFVSKEFDRKEFGTAIFNGGPKKK